MLGYEDEEREEGSCVANKTLCKEWVYGEIVIRLLERAVVTGRRALGEGGMCDIYDEGGRRVFLERRLVWHIMSLALGMQ